MRKIFASIALSLFITAIASPAMAYTDDKPKKAKTEQCSDKKDCDKAATACEKSCATKCNSGKNTAEKK